MERESLRAVDFYLRTSSHEPAGDSLRPAITCLPTCDLRSGCSRPDRGSGRGPARRADLVGAHDVTTAANGAGSGASGRTPCRTALGHEGSFACPLARSFRCPLVTDIRARRPVVAPSSVVDPHLGDDASLVRAIHAGAKGVFRSRRRHFTLFKVRRQTADSTGQRSDSSRLIMSIVIRCTAPASSCPTS